jgi:hypothetical protein
MDLYGRIIKFSEARILLLGNKWCLRNMLRKYDKYYIFKKYSSVQIYFCKNFGVAWCGNYKVFFLSAPWRRIDEVEVWLHSFLTSVLDGVLSGRIKGKAVPLQAWSGPEGSRKLRFPDFMTTAQDGGRVVSLTHRPPLPPGNTPGTHFY